MGSTGISATLAGMNRAFCDPPLEVEEIATIARSVARYDPEPTEVITVEEDSETLPLVSAASFDRPPDRTWLWYPYIPDQTMTLLSGREGIGKGMFTAWLAAGVASGKLPDGSTVDPKPVLWITGEDHPWYDIWPRLRAAGWDPAKDKDVLFMDLRHELVLPEDLAILEQTIVDGGFGLVVLDPGRSFFGRRSDTKAAFSYNNETDIRPALQGLLYISAEHKVPTLFIAHWKKGEGDTQDMTSGSAAWRQVVRHALDFASVGGGEGRESALWVSKSNHYKTGFVCSYTIPEAPDWDTANFELGDPQSEETLDDWLKTKRRAQRGGPPIEVDGTEMLFEHLVGSLKPGDVMPAREDLRETVGLSKKQMKEGLTELKASGAVTLTNNNVYRWIGNAAKG